MTRDGAARRGRILPDHPPPEARGRFLDPALARRLRSSRRALDRMKDELILRGYSPRTRKAYLGQARRFLGRIDRPPGELGPDEARAYVGRSRGATPTRP